MKVIRLLIADDHPVFRYGLKALLETEPGFEIVGEASNGEEAVKLAREVQPDVILMDITMPGLNGIEATRQILGDNPEIGILMVRLRRGRDPARHPGGCPWRGHFQPHDR
jgi:DNA-binding NarL/FixJ family response regulator